MIVDAELRIRAKEVRDFLKSIEDIEKRLMSGKKPFYRSQKMLASSRAASFIMMYNCIELAIADSLEEARDQIEKSGKHFGELGPHWQGEIIRAVFKSKLENGCNHEDLLEQFRQSIPMRVHWGTAKSKLPFSGNINHEKVHDLVKKIGGAWRPPKASLGGTDMEFIRRMRNQLAHGEDSFENVGNQCTTKDLVEKFDRTFKFLKAFLTFMDKYMSEKSYCSP